jgi:hypothetical protein
MILSALLLDSSHYFLVILSSINLEIVFYRLMRLQLLDCYSLEIVELKYSSEQTLHELALLHIFCLFSLRGISYKRKSFFALFLNLLKDLLIIFVLQVEWVFSR